jgi:uncharacterized protein (DUF2147 family)
VDFFPAPGHSLLENQSLLSFNAAATSLYSNAGSLTSSQFASPFQDTFSSSWWRSPASLDHAPARDGGAVAIFDPSVADISTLIAGLAPGTNAYILDPTWDAIAQITSILAHEHNISNLSLFAHGDPGEIDFSSMTFDFSDLGTYSADLQQWTKSLAQGAGISIYSCELAGSEQGKAFLQEWSQLAGVGIAASSRLVGNEALGGNWTLDFETSSFTAPDILQDWAKAAYQHVLDTFIVTNTNDSGAGSLRQAILNANALAGTDTITFDPTVFGSSPQTITLTSGQLIINDSVDIFGPLSSTLTVSGNNSNRVFFVNQGTVNLANFTIANGLARGGDGSSGGGGGGGFGGGLFINSGTVNLTNLVFTGNQAIGGNGGTGAGGGGGGLGGRGGIGGGGGGGGGGFAGNGGNGDGSGVSGGGGGGFAGNGGNGTITTGGTGGAGTGTILGGTVAGDGIGSTGGTGGSGGGIGGGGGGGSNGNGGAGSIGGGGGGSGGNNTTGGSGGDFGGGGGGSIGGAGGFGGGGGGGFTAGGNGGFGGGGGGSIAGGAGNGQGGTLAGAGGSNGGGGGAGLGGAIFIRNGSLNIAGGVFNNNAATGGSGGGGGAQGGQGKAGAIFTGAGVTFTSSNLVFNGNTASNAGSTASDNGNLYVSPPTIALTPTTLPTGTAGTTYSQTLTASGGTTPYSFVITGGSLPSGFTLSPTGQLSGTTGLAGTFNFTATATDANSFTGSNPYQITIAPAAPSIVSFFSGSGQSATVNNAFANPLAARVTDQFNNPISGVTVTFTAPTTGASGSFTGGANTITATTDINGIATTSFTANTIAGTYSVLANIQGGTTPAAFSLTNVAGNAASLAFTGLPTNTAAGASNSFTVTAQDIFGNTATSYNGVVLFTSSDGQAVLPTNATLTNGTGTFNATLRTIGSQTINASSGGLMSASATLTVDPGAASTLLISGLPSSTIAGTQSSLTLTAKDAFGNTVTNYNGVVLLTSSDGQAVLPTNATLTNGTGTFNVILKTAGTQTLNASSGPLTATSASLTVTPSVATNFAIAGVPAAVTAGASQPFTVTARDAFGNTATNYTGVVLFTSSDGQAILPSSAALTNGTGTFNATLRTAGTQSLRVTDTVTSSITGTANTTVTPATANKFLVTGLPATTTAGNPNSFTVTAQDAFGNTDTNYTGVVLFTSSDGQAILPPNATLNNGIGTFSTILRTAGIQSIQVADSQNSAITGQQSGITVNPAATSQFLVSGLPATLTAGTPSTFTVTAQDAFGNTTPGYTGTVLFTSSDGQAVLPTSATLNAGTGTFNATLRTAGTQSVTATDSTTSSITGTQSGITVNAGTATTLALTGLPTTLTAGTSQAITVTAQDDFGNTATGYNGVVLFTSSDGQAVLPTNANLTNGAGTFNATLRTAGNQTVSVSSGVLRGASASVAVTAGAASQFLVAGIPSTVVAGTAQPLTVTAQDSFGNTATTYNGVVLFTSNDGQAILPTNARLTNGTGNFNATLRTAGTGRTITATDSTNSSITGSATGITVVPGAASTLLLSGFPSTVTAGDSQSVTVTAQDAFGNTATGYSGVVLFTSSDGQAVLPSSATVTGGTGTFNATLRTAGQQSLTATDSVNNTLTTTLSGITVNPATASSFLITGPSTVTAGTAQNFTAVAKDAFGNTATGYTGTVLFTSSDGQAVLPTNVTFNNGTATFSATLKTAGTRSLTITDSTNSSLTGTNAGITVTPADASTIQLTGLPTTTTAGVAQSFNVIARDPFGNTATGYQGVVLFTSSDGQAVLPTNATLNNGTGTFSATLKTAGTQTLLANSGNLTGTPVSITVNPAAANNFLVSGFPQTAIAGTSQSFNVTARDAFGNTATGYNGVLLFTSSDGQATLPPNGTLTNGTGTFNASLKTAGTQSLTVRDSVNSAITGTQTGIVITPAATSTFIVAGLPATTVAGTSQPFTVTAKDDFGNTTTGYNGVVLFTSSDGQAVLPTNATLVNGTGTFGATLRTAGPQSVTATDASNSSITGTQSNILVTPAAASNFVVSGFPNNTIAGTAQTFDVLAKDPFGNTAVGYTGTVLFTSSDGQAVLPTNARLTNGAGTFSATLKTAGTQSLRATDSINSSITGVQTGITILPSTATKLLVSGFPTTVVAGTSQSLTVTAQDEFGNTATGYNGVLLFTSNDGQAVLPTNATLTNGTGTFNATLRTVGTTRSITATDSTNNTITGTQSGITVTPAAASRFVVSGFGNPSVAGTQKAFTVTAQDAFGNTDTNYNGVVLFTSNDGQATLPSNSRLTNGTGTFNATLRTAGTRSLTATDSTNSNITGTQAGIVITPAATNRLQLTGLPTTTTAGVANNFTVTAQDAFGNTTPGYTGTVLFTSSDGKAVLPTNTTLVNGTGNFIATLGTAGSQSISVNSTGLTGASSTLTVTPAAASLLTLTGPTTTAAGAAQPFTVTAKDAFGNIDTNYTGTVLFTSSDGQAVLPTNATLNAGTGTFNATLRTVGTQTLNISSGNLTGASTSLTVTPGTATRLVLSGLPTTTIAGTSQTFTLTAQDAFGNTATNYSGVVLFTSSDGQAVLPTNVSLNQGTGTFSATLRTAGTQGLIANSGNLTSAAANITVTPAAASTFQIAGLPASTQAGTANNFTLTARDAFGNTATGYTGTVLFTSSDGQAVLPPGSTLTNGVGTFSATFRTAATQSLTARDSVIPTITGTRSGIIVTPGATSQFRVTGLPPSTTAGAANQLTVTAQDAFGNITPTYTGSVNFTSSDAQAVLPASVSFSSGTGTITTGVVLKTAGLQSVTAIDTQDSNITGTLSGVTVTPAATSSLLVSGLPATVTAGTANAFTVTAQDAFGNITPGYAGRLRFTSDDNQAILPVDTTLTNGVGNFTATLRTAGTRSLTATDTGNPSLTGTQSGITVNPAAASTLLVSGFPALTTAGTQQAFTVTAQDPFGNIATGYTGTLLFTSSDGQAVLPTNSTLTNGTGTFNATLRTAGSQTLIASDSTNASLTGTQSGITVTPAATSTFLLSGFPSTVTAGNQQSFTVTAQDAFGNIATGYTGVVVFTSNDGQAVLPNSSGLVNGVGNFTATLKTAGTRSLTATDLANNSITATQTGITVNPAATSQIVVAGLPSTTTAGVNQTFTVTAQDPFGNVTPSYTTPIAFASSDSQAVLPTSAPLTNGTGSFTTNLRTAGNQTFTVSSGNLPAVLSNLTVNAAAASIVIPTVATTQAVDINRTLFNPLRVRVTDAFGNPIAGNTVTFSAPSSGPGATFNGSVTVTTNGLGIATASPLVANNQPGTYNVTATAAGVATPVTFNFTNRNPFIIDFNGDNKSDLIWRESSTNTNGFWLLDGVVFSTAALTSPAPTPDLNWVIASSGDFNGDGQRDLLWRNNATGENLVWLMNGTTSLSSVALPSAPAGWYIAGTGDFVGDGGVDIVWRNYITGDQGFWLMNGTSLAGTVSLGTVPTNWAIAGVGDLNGDGQPDLLWQNYTDGTLGYWAMNGTSFVSGVILQPFIPPNWVLSGLADFTGDGQPDFLWRNYVTGENGIWVMNGANFVSSVLLPSPIPASWTLTNKPPIVPV